MSPDDKRLILLGTHDFYVHSVVFDPAAKSLELTHSLRMKEDPSWLTRHPHPIVICGTDGAPLTYLMIMPISGLRTRPDLVYANSHVERKLYTLRVMDEGGQLEVLQEAESGGVGPTHIAILGDESAIVVAQYGQEDVGKVALLAVNKDGTFKSDRPAHLLSPPFERKSNGHERMENPHVHGVYLHKRTGDIFAPDLGSNNVLRLECSVEGGIRIKSIVEGFEPTEGPRHAQLHPNGDYLYTLTEMGCSLVIHKIQDGGSSSLIGRHTTLPPCDRTNPEMCAAEIVLCPALQPDSRSLLICGNRFSTQAEGDALALFEVSPEGGVVERTKQGWLYGAGKHLRGIAYDSTGRYVVVLARDGGGMTMYERVGEHGLELSVVARLPEVAKTVVPVWIN